MASRKGSLLETTVENIFRAAGFKTSRNVRMAGYEIDVLAEFGSNSIVCECKQNENSTITIRNLIHEWADKNKEIGAKKIILVLYGMDIKETDVNLARSRNIVLWDEDALQRYSNLMINDKDGLSKQLFIELNIETNTWNNLEQALHGRIPSLGAVAAGTNIETNMGNKPSSHAQNIKFILLVFMGLCILIIVGLIVWLLSIFIRVDFVLAFIILVVVFFYLEYWKG